MEVNDYMTRRNDLVGKTQYEHVQKTGSSLGPRISLLRVVYPEPQAERYGTIDPERIPDGRMSRICESGDIRSDKDVYEVTSDVLEHDQTWGRYRAATAECPDKLMFYFVAYFNLIKSMIFLIVDIFCDSGASLLISDTRFFKLHLHYHF
jgi:hypothetical protein